MQLEPSQLQFTLARLLACTTLVAVAAWATTLNLPISVSTPSLGDRNLSPGVIGCLLLAAAVGVLFHGKRGALDGARAGCGLLLIVLGVVLPAFLALRAILVWAIGGR